MNFVALDFETANSARSSVCSIGLVEYENGALKREYYRLVKPHNNYFAPMNVRVHGITKVDVSDAEEFDVLWNQEIKQLVEGKLVVAHNAQFDMGVLRAVLDQYNLSYPMLAYNCTVNISKKTWSLPKYNLNIVSKHLGFIFDHHHALEDAKAAAHILLSVKEELAATDIKDLVKKTGTTNGMMYEGGYEPARLNKRKKPKIDPSKSFVAATTEFDLSHPYYAASIVFAGQLSQLKREEAIQEIVNVGAVWHPTVEHNTNFIVVSESTYENYKQGKKTSELERAEILLSQGYPIEIIMEDVFLEQLKSSSM
ncbi:exonuclease domain-containing protein [Halobacillus litoralis]|uniref:exonuclease domain-containing protein n=1 Tax=Halobacillus litoralis TaxID=45668 RepID=UPI0024929534|nr:exonuclease domain-containing protein [Halobacillus litoralis]